MRYIAAYMLATLGGNDSPSAADIKKILSAGGVEVNDSEVAKLVSELSGKNLDSLISAGSSKLASMPAGGAAASASGPSSSSAAPAAAGGKAAAKEEKKAEKEEEEGDMGFGLFD